MASAKPHPIRRAVVTRRVATGEASGVGESSWDAVAEPCPLPAPDGAEFQERPQRPLREYRSAPPQAGLRARETGPARAGPGGMGGGAGEAGSALRLPPAAAERFH